MSIPYMRLYVGDYLGDTRDLTTEQHGAYLLLLMAMWRTTECALPHNPAKLARMAGLTPARWAKISPEVMKFFQITDGEISQKRLKIEHQKASETSSIRSDAGKKGADAKSLKPNEPAPAKASGADKQMLRDARASSRTITKERGLSNDNPADDSEPIGDAPASKKRKPEPRASRLSIDWTPSEEQIAMAEAVGIDRVRVVWVAEKFRDYWCAKPSKNTSLDWSRNWRTWLKNEVERGGGPNVRFGANGSRPPGRGTEREENIRNMLEGARQAVDRRR